MADDPDAIWKPGYDTSSADGPPADPETEDEADPGPDRPVAAGVDRGGLVDRFRPAVESVRRSELRTSAEPAAPDPAEREPLRAAAVETVEPTFPEFDGADQWIVEQDAEEASTPRSWRRVALGVGAVFVAFAVGAAVVALLRSDNDPRRPDPEEISGADDRSLPASVDELWSTRLPGSGRALSTSLAIDGRELIVAVVDDGSQNRSRVIGIDATTGEPEWGRSFAFAPPEARLLDVIDGVVVIEQADPISRRMFGLSAADGSTVWERRDPGRAFDTVLLGTELVASITSDGVSLTTFIDPATGEDVGQVVGDVWSTDLDGTWYLNAGDEIVALDLADGWSDPVTVVDDAPIGDLAVVDGRILVVDALGRISEVEGDEVRSISVADGVDLPRARSMSPVGGSSFVVVGDGRIVGLELVGDTVRQTWSRQASLRSFAVTDRGIVMAIGDAGVGFADGVDLLVVDAITGERISGAAAVFDEEDLPLLVGDGFVTTVDTDDGAERTGFDLEGNELWTLETSGKFRVGDELVAVMTNTPTGFVITAYGAAA